MFASHSVLFALLAAMSSFVNGAIVPRDATFTFITPQPTSPVPSTMTSSLSPGTTSTTPVSTTSASSSATASTTSITPCTTSCVVTTSTTPCPTITTSSTTVATTSTTPCTTSSIPVVTPCVKCTPSVTTTPSIPVITTGTANCNGVQAWQASLAYTAGNQVIFNNQLFTAKQWTFNNEPPTHSDQWTAGGTCAQPINNKAQCAGVAAWQSNVAYTTGNQVTFNNHLWSAVQWTQSNAPGDTSGLWKDLGACA